MSTAGKQKGWAGEEEREGSLERLTTLPPEVLLHLLSYVTPWDLCSLSMVCRTLERVSRDESLWRPLGNPAWEAIHASKGGWKGAYMVWLREALKQYINQQGKSRTKYAGKSTDFDVLMKSVLVGPSGGGKSSLLKRYVEDRFDTSYCATIGVDFKIKTVEHGGMTVKMQMWDTAGQERFRTIMAPYYSGAHAIYVVYDVSDETSFADAKKVKEEIDRFAVDPPILVLANKDDIAARVVSEQDGRQLAQEWGAQYFECSAKTGEGVNEAFIAAIDLALSKLGIGAGWTYVAGTAKPDFVPSEEEMEELARAAMKLWASVEGSKCLTSRN